MIQVYLDFLTEGANSLLRHSFISEQSRKAKPARLMYEQLRNKVPRDKWIDSTEWESIQGTDGIPVPDSDKGKILALRLLDEHLSPYVKTDMNLFQMHMLDEYISVVVYKAANGWLFAMNGVSDGPAPFGQNGFDTR